MTDIATDLFAETAASPEQLRAAMVEAVTALGHARTPAVADALRTVPRHLFVAEAARVEEAYAQKTVVTRTSWDGTSLSCASDPSLVAMTLDRLQVRPGDRVLEIGAGTGYNAALLAHLTGPDGQVTTVDVDDETAAGARTHLDANGYEHVRVIARDGLLGAPEHAPFDRIVVTVGTWDLPVAWCEQLAPGGRLVVPLRWRGTTRSVAFVRDGDRLRADTSEVCGFVPMAAQEGEQQGRIDTEGHVSVYWDADQGLSLGALHGVLEQPKRPVWSGHTVVADEPFDGVWLRLIATEPGTCRITADEHAVETGLCTPGVPASSPALAEDESLAYFAMRRLQQEGERTWELGAIGHGPLGEELAERLCAQVRTWSENRTAHPVITAHAAGTGGGDEVAADEAPAPASADVLGIDEALVIDKGAVRMTVTYP